jgi:hypothetical protein
MTLREPRDGVFFDHIYKAGGSSIDQVLASWVGRDQISPLRVDSYQRALRLYRDKRAITGHFHFLPGDVLDPGRYHLTMLRHPVDRVLSHYFFARNMVEGAPNAMTNFAKTRSLEEFVDSTDAAATEITCNAQTRHFMALVWDGHSALTGLARRALARQALDRYDLVGVFPLFEEFVAVLGADLGVTFDAPIPHLNATRNRPREHEVPKSLRARIESLNDADIELFEYARQIFLQKRRRTWTRLIAGAAGAAGDPARRPGGLVPAAAAVPGAPAAPTPREFGNRRLALLAVQVRGQITQSHEVYSGDLVEVSVTFAAHETADDLTLGILIRDADGVLAFATNTRHMGHRIRIDAAGSYVAKFSFFNTLGIGGYSVTVALHTGYSHVECCYHWREDAARFRVVSAIGHHFDGHTALAPRLSVSRGDGGAVTVLKDSTATAPLVLHRTEQPLTQFGAAIECPMPPERLRVGETVRLALEVRNTSRQTWPLAARLTVCVSYHWIDAAGNMAVFDGLRTAIPRAVEPADTLAIGAAVAAPPCPGRFTLAVTLLQEYVAWFDAQGVEPLRLGVVVSAA